MELTNIVARIGWNDTSDSGFCQKFRKLVIRTLNYGEPIARYVIETASNAEQYGAGAVRVRMEGWRNRPVQTGT